MKFLNYIKGYRRGKDAHRIEKEAMADPFLADAIDGFDSVDDDHLKQINELSSRIRAKANNKKKQHPLWQIAAACAILIFGIGGYFVLDSHKSSLYAQDTGTSAIINIYVPEEFYTENIIVIAQTNTNLAKSYKPNISRFKIEEDNNSTTVSDEELKNLSNNQSETDAIEVYVPEEFYERSKEIAKDGKPQPIIGFEKYNLYLKSAMKRPTDDACKDRKGKVAVEFSVDENGQPYDFEVKYSLCGTSDKEAVRLIQAGPKWTLGNERVVVKVQF